MNLSRITIVLDQVQHPDNLGSSLRAMKNTGLSRIFLSAPKTRNFERARVLATDAIDLLPEMRVFEHLSDAIAHGTLVVGTTSRQDPGHRSSLWLDEFIELAAQETDKGGELVVVFGNERRGLSNAELDLCHLVVNIPTSPKKSSINLAQSVMLISHALFSNYWKSSITKKIQTTSNNHFIEQPEVTAGLLNKLYERALQILMEINFLNRQNPQLIFSEFKRLLERARPTRREIELLISVIKKTEYTLKQKK